MTLQKNALLRVSKNTSMLFIGTVTRMLLSFGFIILVARFLGVEGFGKYAITWRYFELLISLCATGLGILLTREIAQNAERLNRHLTASVIMVSILSLFACLILLWVARTFGYADDTQTAILVASIAILPATICLMFEAVFVAFEEAEYVTYGIMIESILRIGLGLIALFLGHGLLALFWALVIARVCTLFFYCVLLKRRFAELRWDFAWTQLKKLARDWRVFAMENWLSNIYNHIGIIFLSIVHGEYAVGVFEAAGKILRLGSVVAHSYTTAIFPYLSRVYSESRDSFRRLSRDSLRYMMTFVLPVVIFIEILADKIIILFYSNAFTDSIPILRLLVWVLLLHFFSPFLSHILFARGEQKKSLQVAILRLVLFVAIILWLIPAWGAIGLAWARLIAACVAFCLYFSFAMREDGALRTLLTLGKPAIAGAALASFLLILPANQLMMLLVSGAALYVFLIIIFRVFSSSETAMLRQMINEGFHKISGNVKRT